MISGYTNDPLIDQLRHHQVDGELDFWSFKKTSRRSGAHALLHYPAMMVPSLQGLILEAITEVLPKASRVFDPFVGSGTVMVEAMERGLDFDGIDINPLAGLACLVKSGPYYVKSFNHKKEALLSGIDSDKRRHQPEMFKGIDKWFLEDAATGLAKIKHHIQAEDSLWARRLFWLALCRVVRMTSNTRMSTYKLHIKADTVNQHNPVSLFKIVVNDFSTYLNDQHKKLSGLGVMKRGRYTGKVHIKIADNNQISAKLKKKYDVVMTSPPYGDNATTIPYGQYAYLPLNWIDVEDITKNISSDLFARTSAIDAVSLGGSLRGVGVKTEELIERYSPAKSFVSTLKENENGIKRFSSFFWDLEKSVKKISSVTAVGGYQTWTIANRSIGGMTVPMESLLHLMLENEGMQVVGKIDRQILNKKMPSRNNSSSTMTSESILLARMN